MTAPDLLATCWTSAGDASPAGDQRSPLDVGDRVDAVAGTGWQGLGLVLADLRRVHDGVGFAALADRVREAGLVHTEVELVEGWWATGADKERSDEARDLLFDAATALGARHVKVGPPVGTGPADWRDLVAPLRDLARVAAERGVRLALEPLPFSTVTTVPLGATLVGEVGVPSLGLCVDAWHVFRAHTPLEELRAALDADTVVAVELTDADPDVVGSLFEDTVDRRRYPGDGCFDLDGLVRVLRDVGFAGPWGVEILSAAHRATPLDEGLRRARASALAVLDRP